MLHFKKHSYHFDDWYDITNSKKKVLGILKFIADDYKWHLETETESITLSPYLKEAEEKVEIKFNDKLAVKSCKKVVNKID